MKKLIHTLLLSIILVAPLVAQSTELSDYKKAFTFSRIQYSIDETSVDTTRNGTIVFWLLGESIDGKGSALFSSEVDCYGRRSRMNAALYTDSKGIVHKTTFKNAKWNVGSPMTVNFIIKLCN